MQRITLTSVLTISVAMCVFAAPADVAPNTATAAAAKSWDAKAAAAYLDQRAEWWMSWDMSARDHQTFCISCHTALPYALSRATLRSALAETQPSPQENRILENVTKRVRLWSEVEPFYNDAKSGIPKSMESRGTESVLNALILSTHDARTGKLSADARLALDNMWGQQIKTGDKAGALPWLNFHNEPWEADDSQYWGNTLAAIAIGSAPDDYRTVPEIQDKLKSLTAFLKKGASMQTLLNRLSLLWASTKLPGLLTATQQEAILRDVLAKQQEDGGWATSALVVGTWKRRDGTALETKSDGFATGLVTFVLEQAPNATAQVPAKRGLGWLVSNQNKEAGSWSATSLNKERDPASDRGRFMSDAATAYSVLALTAR